MQSSIISTPLFDKKDYIGINGVGIDQIEHPHFQEWFKFIIEGYKPPKPPRICLFIPCSAIKPYYGSPIHKVINKSMEKYEDYLHKIVISNAGIIPYEFSNRYPFNSYDWNPKLETEEIKKIYIEITVNRLITFFNKHSTKYIGFISYFRPDAEDLIALKVASETTGTDIIHIDVNIKNCDNELSNTSDRDLVLITEHNLDKLKNTIENTIENIKEYEVSPNTMYELAQSSVAPNELLNIQPNRGNNMPKRIHQQTEVKLDISSSDIIKDTTTLISDILNKVWSETYLADLDIDDYIELVVEIWIRYYVDSGKTKEAIEKIKNAKPPEGLKTYLVFNLFDDEDNLIIDHSEMPATPLFRIYLPTKDLWDTYAYNTHNGKFESLEIIEPAYIQEIKEDMTLQEKMNLDEIILQAYGFHNNLLGMTARKIRLYTAQHPDKIKRWNNKGIIPKGVYFTDSMARTEYYWSDGDIIVDYKLPEDKIVSTSEFGGAKEYVTIFDIPIN